MDTSYKFILNKALVHFQIRLHMSFSSDETSPSN